MTEQEFIVETARARLMERIQKGEAMWTQAEDKNALMAQTTRKMAETEELYRENKTSLEQVMQAKKDVSFLSCYQGYQQANEAGVANDYTGMYAHAFSLGYNLDSASDMVQRHENMTHINLHQENLIKNIASHDITRSEVMRISPHLQSQHVEKLQENLALFVAAALREGKAYAADIQQHLVP